MIATWHETPALFKHLAVKYRSAEFQLMIVINYIGMQFCRRLFNTRSLAFECLLLRKFSKSFGVVFLNCYAWVGPLFELFLILAGPEGFERKKL
jgi:hypothetical protein